MLLGVKLVISELQEAGQGLYQGCDPDGKVPTSVRLSTGVEKPANIFFP